MTVFINGLNDIPMTIAATLKQLETNKMSILTLAVKFKKSYRGEKKKHKCEVFLMDMQYMRDMRYQF